MDAKELRDQYVKFEERYGADAPVAMLRWLRHANHIQDDQCQLLAAAIGDVLITRCMDVFGADETGKIQAYQNAADRVLRMVRLANLMEMSAEAEV